MISGLFGKKGNPVAQWGQICFAQLYFAGFFSLLAFIPYIQSAVYQPFFVLMVFALIWVYDSGAYLIGSWKGKHRLFKRISPRKSWEGLLGGLLIVIIISIELSFKFTVLPCYQWLIFALITVVSATFGDLLESLIKRTYGKKDSGKILPGHGGVFDRFDSAIMASPFIYIYLEWVIRS